MNVKMPKKQVTVELSPLLPVKAAVGVLKVALWPLRKAEEFVIDQTIMAMSERAVVLEQQAMAQAIADAAAQAEAPKPRRTRVKVEA